MMAEPRELSLDQAKWRLTMIGLDPHPVFHGYIETMLLMLANSKDRDARYMAVAHRLLPEVKLVFMQDDPDAEVRAMVTARLTYGDPK